MNNPNPFLPHGAFLEQKNKARTRLKIAVYFSISLSVMVLMVLLIQGCKKPSDSADTSTGTDTNSLMSQLPTNPPDMGSTSNSTAMTPPPETNPPVYTPPPQPPAPPTPPLATTEDYTVVKGDTFATIAKNAHVSTKAIVDANPGVDPKRLKIGQKLHMPSGGTASAAVNSTAENSPEAGHAVGSGIYKVKSGDTLTSIAKHFHVTIKSIQSANKLGTTSIKVGQALKIPGGAATAAAAPAPAPAETLPPPSMSAPTSSPAPAATTAPAAH